MSVLTFFVAQLTCPVCGTTSPESTATGMSSKLLDSEYHDVLRVGDSPDISLIDIQSAYLELHAPGIAAPVSILQDWICPTCHSLNWALVVFKGWKISSITAVPLTRRALDEANFITERIYDYFTDITGQPLLQDGDIRPDIWTVLRDVLPA